uniref:NADH:ubiquinone reductase (H(+)-translocating) n=1 Tax=Thetys vagina TaxID=942565 RepID=A0AA86IMI2_9UROC|nr:NADH dehydrogenase subunit 5 [Thetys vagina]
MGFGFIIFGSFYISSFILSFNLITMSVWLSVSLVILAFVYFIPWYMSSEPSKNYFISLVGVFSLNILALSFTPFGLLFFFFWEMLGLCSYLLVRWWGGRDLARSLAVVGLLSSRIGDFSLFLIYTQPFQSSSLSYMLLSSLAISSKSAQLLFFPWLLGAMEGPGPVSALLHSSTLVLAGVILGVQLSYFGQNEGLLISGMGGLITGVTGSFVFSDLKKRVACSTVYNVGLMFIWIYYDLFSILSLHLVIHAILKSSIFTVLGINSHLMETQDTRLGISGVNVYMVSLFKVLLLLLSFLPVVGVLLYKENMIEYFLGKSTSVWVLFLLYNISWLGLIFFLDCLILSNFPQITHVKLLPSPSFTVSFISVAYCLGMLLNAQAIFSFSNFSIGSEMSFMVFLMLGLIVGALGYLRSNLRHMNFVTGYNNMVFGNGGLHLPVVALLEYFNFVGQSYASQYSINKIWGFKVKLNYKLVSCMVLSILLIGSLL